MCQTLEPEENVQKSKTNTSDLNRHYTAIICMNNTYLQNECNGVDNYSSKVMEIGGWCGL